ncbi:MAG: hypothetical protein KF906_06680 [Actinobacteria bacterium]|nr:hypothetical protein [Actinomycetota bacterium]
MEPAVRVDADLADAPSITLTADDLAAIEGLRRMHAERAQATAASPATLPTAPTPDATVDVTVDRSGGACPIPGILRGGATSCPVAPGTRPAAPIERSRADLFVRRLLRIQDRPADLSDASTYRAFQRSMCISAVRCTLTYVIFPFVLPGISFLKGVGPVVGILIGSFALVCDTFTIRRFFAVDHKYRWQFSAIAFSIMCLLTVLLVEDLAHVTSQLFS